jgi:hypothetical protein
MRGELEEEEEEEPMEHMVEGCGADAPLPATD